MIRKIVFVSFVKPPGYVPGYERDQWGVVLPQKLVQALCEILT